MGLRVFTMCPEPRMYFKCSLIDILPLVWSSHPETNIIAIYVCNLKHIEDKECHGFCSLSVSVWPCLSRNLMYMDGCTWCTWMIQSQRNPSSPPESSHLKHNPPTLAYKHLIQAQKLYIWGWWELFFLIFLLIHFIFLFKFNQFLI